MVPGLGVTYDAAGNETNDGTTAYTYDSENRIISATNSANGASSYLYDANGRRIRKVTTAGGTVDFLYDLGGHEITQVTSAGAWTRGEIYSGGRHLGTYTGGTGGSTYFTFADWLGTERARSLAGAMTPCETITSLPFGDWLTTAGSCGDPSPMHLTGKERDSESGLDNFGARYFSSQYARFMTPDWSPTPKAVGYGELKDPQTLNLYAYVRNNPLAKADVDGHCPWCIAALIGAVTGGTVYVVRQELSGQSLTLKGAIISTAAGAIAGATFGALTGPTVVASMVTATNTIAVSSAGVGTVAAAGVISATVGGVAKRTMATGSLNKAMSDPKAILKDAAAGLVSTVVGHALTGSIESSAATANAEAADTLGLDSSLTMSSDATGVGALTTTVEGATDVIVDVTSADITGELQPPSDAQVCADDQGCKE